MRLGFLVIISFTKRVPKKRTFLCIKPNLLILICVSITNTNTLTDIREDYFLKVDSEIWLFAGQPTFNPLRFKWLFQ